MIFVILVVFSYRLYDCCNYRKSSLFMTKCWTPPLMIGVCRPYTSHIVSTLYSPDFGYLWKILLSWYCGVGHFYGDEIKDESIYCKVNTQIFLQCSDWRIWREQQILILTCPFICRFGIPDWRNISWSSSLTFSWAAVITSFRVALGKHMLRICML